MRGEYEKAALTFTEFNFRTPVMPGLLIRRCGLPSWCHICPTSSLYDLC